MIKINKKWLKNRSNIIKNDQNYLKWSKKKKIKTIDKN